MRPVEVADKVFYLVGGDRLNRDFMASLTLSRGMDAWLYRPPLTSTASATLLTSQGVARWDENEPRWSELNGLISNIQKQGGELHATVHWPESPGSSPVPRTVYGIPLFDRNINSNKDVLAVLLVSSSQAELLHLTRRIQLTALAVAGGGILFGILLSMGLAARVTRPVEKLAIAADEVSAGNLGIKVDDSAHDEIGRLAYAFNRMTRELLEQRERLLQSERVAAWRELARRLAHELKNPLFPLQITVENMLRAKASNPSQFEEVFQESAETLLAEIANDSLLPQQNWAEIAEALQQSGGKRDLEIARHLRAASGAENPAGPPVNFRIRGLEGASYFLPVGSLVNRRVTVSDKRPTSFGFCKTALAPARQASGSMSLAENIMTGVRRLWGRARTWRVNSIPFWPGKS